MLSTRFGIRLAAVSFIIASAVAANAYSLDIMSHGNYTIGSGSFSVAETVIFQNANASIPLLSSMTYTVNTTTLVGSGTYTNGSDSFTFSFQFTTDVPTDGFSGTQNAHGLWAFVSGTGGFSNIASGSGVIASNFNAPLGATSLTTFSGAMTPVPEPATLAMLGLGAAALIRRRKRA